MHSLSPYLFVYGTLRRASDHPMAAMLVANGRYLSFAKAHGRLYDLGAYPGMLSAQTDTDWVHGELYELTDPERMLAVLDQYEGCVPEHPQPYVFERALTEVVVENDGPYSAWVYLYGSSVNEEQRIWSGDYFGLPRHPELG